MTYTEMAGGYLADDGSAFIDMTNWTEKQAARFGQVFSDSKWRVTVDVNNFETYHATLEAATESVL